jgi:hypothetical protein
MVLKHPIRNQQVAGSNPVVGSSQKGPACGNAAQLTLSGIFLCTYFEARCTSQ